MNRCIVALVALMTALTGCGSGSGSSSSPKAMTPAEVAKKFNDLDVKYNSRLNAVQEAYVISFNPQNYPDREAAKEAFLAQIDEVYKEYDLEKSMIELEYDEVKNKYSSTWEEQDEFNKQFKENIVDNPLPRYTSDFIPNTIRHKVNEVIPDLPDEKDIARDLIGRKLSEGKLDGYYKDSWRWEVERGQVSEIEVVEVLKQNNSEYNIAVTMTLTKGNLSMSANLELYYILPTGEGWCLENVISNGLDFIPNGDYRKYLIEEKGGFSYNVYYRNISDVPLLVAITVYYKDGSSKFAWTVGAQECESEYVDYNRGHKIDYVLKL